MARRRWGRKVAKLLRRLHLYSGLFLVPFVLLYGATGYLFNHPAARTDEESRAVDPAILAEAGAVPAPPAALARGIAGALGAALVDGSAAYRGRYVFRRSAGDAEWSLILEPDLSAGEVLMRRRAERARDRSSRRPDRGTGRALARAELDRVRATAERVFDRLGAGGSGAAVRSAPDVTFALAAGGGARIDARLDLRTGELDTAAPDRRAASGPDLTARRFFTRLHTTHTYPSELGARWWFALMVDVMAVAMVVWGLTGLVMWWQIKTLRRIGLAVLALSVLWAGYLALGMHVHLTS